MPKAFPPEFRQDVIAVARKGESSMAQIAVWRAPVTETR
jgi:transposase